MEKKKKEKLAQEEVKEIKGQSDQSLQGEVSKAVSRKMNNLLGTVKLGLCGLPTKTSPEKPFVIKGAASLIAINCPYFGSLTEEEHEQDIVKNSLRVAEATKCGAIVISDLLYLITQGWGKLRPYLTRVSGAKMNPQEVEGDYPESVRKDERYESVEKRLEKGEPVFVSPAQRLGQIFKIIRKAFVDEKGKPIYSGPVYVTLGRLEDEAIAYFTNEWVRIRFFRSRAYADKKIAVLKLQLKKSKSKELEDELDNWLMWRDVWLLMKNISDESTNQAREMITGFFVRKIEETIPNAKVIGTGNTFYEIGVSSRMVMVTGDKDRLNIQGNLAKTIKEKSLSFGKGRSPDKLPDLILGMGPNPFFEARLNTYQASSDPADKQISMITQLPMCIDAFRYRSIIRDSNVLKDMITRVGQKSGFESGMVMFSWYPGLVQPLVDFYGSRLLNNKDIFKDAKSLEAMIRGTKEENLLMYFRLKGDEHCGAGEVVMHRCPGNSKLPLKYNWQVEEEFLMGAQAPLIATWDNGDTTNQQNWNYGTDYEGANRELPSELLEKLNGITSDVTLTATEKMEKMIRVVLEGNIRMGVHSPDLQTREYIRSMKPYAKNLVEILRLKKKTGICFDGSLSTILYIMGNHCTNTYKKKNVPVVSDALQIIEGLKKQLAYYLMKHPVEGLTSEDVEKELSAPRNGYLGEARGSMGVGGNKSYAIMLKHKQGDANAAQKRSQRRSVKGNEVGLAIVNLHGDRHVVEIRVSRDLVDIEAGCSLGTGVFGADIDGSDQDVCSVACGLPVGGLKCGPVRFVLLDEETMRNYAEKPFKIESEKVFKNALK
ncbi:MAG: hypothetical protein AAB626_02470 [Patescibacteria group bacterium]